MTFEIRPVWRPRQTYAQHLSNDAPTDTVLDEVSTCELVLSVDDSPMTRLMDTQGRVHNGPQVSGFRLAEWLLWNWWRIRWEPEPAAGQSNLPWRQAHETAGIGGGWPWPSLTFASDGRTIAIRSTPTAATVAEPVSYLGHGERIVRALPFEWGVDSLLDHVIEHLKEEGIQSDALSAMAKQLVDERDDPRLSTYRRLEALLGRSPDEGDPAVIERLIEDGGVLGEQATDELAAGTAHHANGATTTADDLLAMAHGAGFPISDSDTVAVHEAGNVASTGKTDVVAVIPWQAGVDAARRLRDSEGLDDRPITDRRLCEMCGLPGGAFRKASTVKPPMAYTLSTASGRRLVFRARVPEARRFDAARLLGDKVLVQNGESLQPATASFTFRQKMQRAFAAELLCPFDALATRLKGDRSTAAIEKTAAEFRVPTRLVASHRPTP